MYVQVRVALSEDVTSVALKLQPVVVLQSSLVLQSFARLAKPVTAGPLQNMSVEQAVIVLFVVQLDLVVVDLDLVDPLSVSTGPFVITTGCGGAVILGPGGMGKLIPKSGPGTFIPSGGHNEIKPQNNLGQPMFQRPSGT